MIFIVSILTFYVLVAVGTADAFSLGLYIIPFAGLPIIISVFMDSRTAIFALTVCVLMTALAAPFQFQFVVIQFIVCTCATFSIYHLSRRSQLLNTAILSFVLYTFAYTMMHILNEGDLSGFSWRTVGIFGINSILLSFAYLLILVVERIFGFTSTVTLVELSDINNPILRNLAEVAPALSSIRCRFPPSPRKRLAP